MSNLIDRLGISRATVYRLLESDPAFPRPVKRWTSKSRTNPARTVPLLFFVDEIDAYLDKLIADRDRQNAARH